MQLRRTVSLVLGIVLLAGFSSALYYQTTPGDMFYDSNVDFSIGDTYEAGDTIRFNLSIANHEQFPLPPSYAVVHLVKGCSQVYERNSRGDCNIIKTKRVENIHVGPSHISKVPVEFDIPDDAAADDYRLDVYVQPGRGYIQGFVEALYEPVSETFQLQNGGSFPDAKINRNKTIIAGATAQSGPAFDPNAYIDGGVYVTAMEDFTGTLELKLCEWDDTSCDDWRLTKSFDVDVSGGETTPVMVNFRNPDEPGAYAIRLVLKDENGRTHSIYKSRIVSQGTDARIQKQYIDRLYYTNGDNVTVRSFITGPAFPGEQQVVEDATVTVTARDLASGETIGTESSTVPRLEQSNYTMVRSSFDVADELSRLEVCTEVTKDGSTLDRTCSRYVAPSYGSDRHVLSADATYTDGTLALEVCVNNEYGVPVQSTLDAALRQDGTTVQSFDGQVDGCRELSYNVDPGNYSFRVEDTEADLINTFDVVAAAEAPEEPGTEQPDEPATPEQPAGARRNMVLIGGLIVVLGLAAFLYLRGGTE